MKNLKYTFLLFFINYQIIAQINSAIVTYKKTYAKQTNSSHKITESQKKRFEALQAQSDKLSNKISFKLYYSNYEATFKSEPFIGTPQETRFVQMALLPFGSGLYYNSKEDKLHQINSLGEDFIIIYPKNYTKWQITKESKKIGKYVAYKAIAKEKYGKNNERFYTIEAWFTPDVNINYGPIGYSGLPGLILELSKSKVTYYVEGIILNPKDDVFIKKPTKGVKITNEEFKKMASGAMERYKKIRG